MGRLLLKLTLFLIVAEASLLSAAVPDVKQPGSEAASSKIIVFGDVHGGAKELEALLSALELIDASGNWSGGTTRLVSLGDLLDRGPDSRRVMDLLMQLERQAPQSGGSLHLVLGNHELMNLTGDLRYVALEEYAAFSADEDPAVRASAFEEFAATYVDNEPVERAFTAAFPPGYFGHRAAFEPEGHYGSWLLDKPQILKLDAIGFVHGGLSQHFATESIASFNTDAQVHLRRLLSEGRQLIDANRLEPWQDFLTAEALSPLDATAPTELPAGFLQLRESLSFANNGPAWYRGTAACHPLIEAPRFERVLDAQSLDLIIMGHTPTNPRIVLTRFGGRAILADTGMLGSYYRGRPSAVIIEQGQFSTLTLSEAGRLEPRRGRTAVDIRAAGDSSLIEALRQSLVDSPVPRETEIHSMQLNGRDYLGFVGRGRQRERLNQLAAQALDRLLGLGLIAPVVAHESNGKSQTVEAVPANAISETQRQAAGTHRPNWCDGSSDYQLMYSLDALLGMDVRSGDSLHYDQTTWLLYLTGQQNVFPTSARLPRYLAERAVKIPVALAQRLARLDRNGLEEVLGEYLGDRQINALLKRRDLILATWATEE